MHIAPMQSIDMMPSLGTLLGSSGRKAIIDRINRETGSTGGVLFGSADDPYAHQYSSFMNTVQAVVDNTSEMLLDSTDFIMDQDRLIPIVSDRDLHRVPVVMQQHILTMPSIRQYVEREEIHAWGWSEEDLPQEDVAGRLISNGYVEQNYAGEFPETMNYHWIDTDPDFSPEQLEIIDQSRQFVDAYITDQTGINGENLDPTDIKNSGRIGGLK